MNEHEITVTEERNLHTASCSCGWVSAVPMMVESVAIAAGERHVASVAVR